MTGIQFALNDISECFPPFSPQTIPTYWSIVVMINGDNWPMALSASLDPGQSAQLLAGPLKDRARGAAASGKLPIPHPLSQYLHALRPHLMQPLLKCHLPRKVFPDLSSLIVLPVLTP